MYKPAAQTVIPDNNPGMAAAARASADASIGRSNAQLDAVRAQAMTAMFGIQKSAQTDMMRTMAFMSAAENTNDAKIEITRINAHLAAREMRNQHAENMKQLKNEERELAIREIEAKKPEPLDVEALMV